jgi:signal transduction histidine kinase
LGYELNSRIADEISRVAAAQVVFEYEDKVVTSTLAAPQQAEFLAVLPSFQSGSATRPSEIRLADEHFLGTSVTLPPASSPAVQLTVLKSLDQATAFLNNLNRELIGLGIVAVLGGSLLVFLISRTFTKPLESLVAGVRALEQGNYVFPIEPKGKDEVSEVTVAFERMRGSLQKTQRELLDAEKLATIGRMASSISHDLRHSLAAILANAEFMCEGGLSSAQREELYQEVRLAVNQMTDLIEALLEFSRTRESLHPSFGSVQLTVQRAIQVVKSHPDYHDVKIEMTCIGNNDGWFDAKRMERVFQNLLLNACEAVPADGGLVQVSLGQSADGVEVLVTDNGPGIAFPVRHTLFEPFVSYAKENGTGLGLTVVQKIVQDHGGEIAVQSSSAAGTVFRVYVPLNGAPERVASAGK